MNSTVTIGIPTYNREHYLRRAIDSALNQTHKNVEIIVADNASSDATADICADYLKTHSNFKFFRHDSNRGGVFNFISLLEKTSGEYFMWLGDDDWLDPNYVEICLKEYACDASLSLVSGVVRYYHKSVYTRTGWTFELNSRNSFLRVLKYYWHVRDNGAFYGLYKTAQLASVPMVDEIGWDWFIVATIAFLGRVKVVPNIRVHRETGGASTKFLTVAKAHNLPVWYAIFPFSFIALGAVRSVMSSGAFSKVGSMTKIVFSAGIYLALMKQGCDHFVKSLIPASIKRRLKQIRGPHKVFQPQ
jgi:glycosyltransferase involved in cell wall biosynthesis